MSCARCLDARHHPEAHDIAIWMHDIAGTMPCIRPGAPPRFPLTQVPCQGETHRTGPPGTPHRSNPMRATSTRRHPRRASCTGWTSIGWNPPGGCHRGGSGRHRAGVDDTDGDDAVHPVRSARCAVLDGTMRTRCADGPRGCGRTAAWMRTDRVRSTMRVTSGWCTDRTGGAHPRTRCASGARWCGYWCVPGAECIAWASTRCSSRSVSRVVAVSP